jgi:hypothetical protein
LPSATASCAWSPASRVGAAIGLFGSPGVEKLATKRDLRGLAKALTDDDPDVRQSAAKALGEIDDPAAVPLIVDQVSKQKDEAVIVDGRGRRAAAARGLARERSGAMGLGTLGDGRASLAVDKAANPRWKMWLVSLLAIYPLVVAFQALLVPDIKAWPLLVRSAMLPLILLTLMTFVVMPVVTRVVRPWLTAPPAAGSR